MSPDPRVRWRLASSTYGVARRFGRGHVFAALLGLCMLVAGRTPRYGIREARSKVLPGYLQRLALRPGDVLVLQCDTALNASQRAELHKTLDWAFGKGQYDALILEKGFSMTVINKENP